MKKIYEAAGIPLPASVPHAYMYVHVVPFVYHACMTYSHIRGLADDDDDAASCEKGEDAESGSESEEAESESDFSEDPMY